MTTNYTEAESDTIIADGLRAVEEMREHVKQIEHARDEQPQRLADARAAAETARDWAQLEEPFDQFVAAVPTLNAAGERTGDALLLPNITAKELLGARLAFDMLDCAGQMPDVLGCVDDTLDRIEEVQTCYFQMLSGEPGLLFLVAMSALSTVASVVIPQMLDDLEKSGSNYDARVMLAEARAKAWNGRVSEIRGGEHE